MTGDDEAGTSHSSLLITGDEASANWSEDSDREEVNTERKSKGEKVKRSVRKSKKAFQSTESASDGDTTDEGEMESCEVDYISDSSESDSSNQDMDKMMEDARQKTKDDSEEEESDSTQDERELTEEGKELNALIKKQNLVPGSGDELDDDPDTMAHDEFIGTTTSTSTKRALEKDSVLQVEPESKRFHTDSNPSTIDKEEVIYYLKRKPIFTKDLVRKFCKKKPGMNKSQVLKALEKIISSLSVEKTKREGKVYLSLRS